MNTDELVVSVGTDPHVLSRQRLTPATRIRFQAGWDARVDELLPALRIACSSLPLLDTRGVANVLGVRPTTVSMWKHRGRAFPAGLLPAARGVRGGNHVPLYRAADLLELAAAAQARNPTRDV